MATLGDMARDHNRLLQEIQAQVYTTQYTQGTQGGPYPYPPNNPEGTEMKDDVSQLSQAARDRRQKGQTRLYDLIKGDHVRIDGRIFTVSGHERGLIFDEQGRPTTPDFPRTSRTIREHWGDDATLIDGAEVTAPERAKVSFDSVILPSYKKQAILDAIQQVDNHDLIFKQWGFGEVFEKGTAISMLFYGEPGTGKTLMAQAIADKYSYPLKIISTAEIETPEPGGAERALQAAFKEAETNTVLLFDECDSLVSSRAHMGSILAAQVNALLTCLEHYKGIAIFTTNRLGALDPAFDRRLSLKLEFDMPDAHHRQLIWKRMFPESAPLASKINWEAIAEVEIAGGHIKNVVLRAARRAAATTKEITQEIIAEALLEELKSKDAFTDAIDNHSPFYGTSVLSRAKGRVELRRG